MPQEMNILRCYSCKTYQVHIVKKARKWQCKLCNEKQSVKQVYFQGSGRDCRLHVQRLNSLKASEPSLPVIASEQDDSNVHYNISPNIPQMSDSDKVVENKWAKYLDSPKKESPPDMEDSFSEDICETENIMPGEKSPYNDRNDDSNNIEKIIDDSDFEIEDVTEDAEKIIDDSDLEIQDAHEMKDFYSMSCDQNVDIDHVVNSQDSNKTKDHNIVTSIFETYDELDEPLNF